MQLKCLAKADSISGANAAAARKLQECILKEAKDAVLAELCRKVVAPLLHVPASEAPVPTLLKDAVEVRFSAKSDADAARIAKAVASRIPWLAFKEQVRKKDGSEWTFSFNPKAFERQIQALKKFDKGAASAVLAKTFVRLSIGKVQESVKTAASPSALSLRPGCLSLSAFGIGTGKAYTKTMLNKAVESGIANLGSAAPVASAVLELARSKGAKSAMIELPMSARDIAIAEKELFPLAAAVSALHVNPKLSAAFVSDGGFVLYSGKRPVGRMGKELDGRILLKDAVRMCEAECGRYGDPSKLLDVLDAEGKRKDERMEELFNDLAKHVLTHSSGPAAKAAKMLAAAAGIKGALDWHGFSKVVGDAAEEIRAKRSHPFASSLQDVVVELNRGRNVVDPRRIKWEADIVQGRLDWLGAVIADVLEEEVMNNAKTVQSLSCTVDWLQNEVQCALSMKYLGSEGIRASFQPCGSIAPKKWRLQLQDIMETGPKWSEM